MNSAVSVTLKHLVYVSLNLAHTLLWSMRYSAPVETEALGSFNVIDVIVFAVKLILPFD